jgi:lipooligosaccharide transport system permease protein
MLAAVCMQSAVFESSYPVMAGIRWTRSFHAMLATPLRVRDVVLGHQLYVASRVGVVAAVYLAVLTAFNAIRSPLALIAWPSTPLLIMFVLAFSRRGSSETKASPHSSGSIMPLFPFGNVFVSRLPQGVRAEIAYVTLSARLI